MLVKRSMSGHSFLELWWMKPGLKSMFGEYALLFSTDFGKNTKANSLCLLLWQD